MPTRIAAPPRLQRRTDGKWERPIEFNQYGRRRPPFTPTQDRTMTSFSQHVNNYFLIIDWCFKMESNDD